MRVGERGIVIFLNYKNKKNYNLKIKIKISKKL